MKIVRKTYIVTLIIVKHNINLCQCFWVLNDLYQRQKDWSITDNTLSLKRKQALGKEQHYKFLVQPIPDFRYSSKQKKKNHNIQNTRWCYMGKSPFTLSMTCNLQKPSFKLCVYNISSERYGQRPHSPRPHPHHYPHHVVKEVKYKSKNLSGLNSYFETRPLESGWPCFYSQRRKDNQKHKHKKQNNKQQPIIWNLSR